VWLSLFRDWVGASTSSHLRMETACTASSCAGNHFQYLTGWRCAALRWSPTQFNHQGCTICGLVAQFGFSTRGSQCVSQQREAMSHITNDGSGINVIIILIFYLFHLPFGISIITVHSLSWQAMLLCVGLASTPQMIAANGKHDEEVNRC
jgi:hypothetical protein